MAPVEGSVLPIVVAPDDVHADPVHAGEDAVDRSRGSNLNGDGLPELDDARRLRGVLQDHGPDWDLVELTLESRGRSAGLRLGKGRRLERCGLQRINYHVGQPRALAARLAHVVVDALQPAPLQAAALAQAKTGGTASTFKSKFNKVPVGTVILKYTTKPPSVIKLGQTVTVEVRATTPIDGVLTGVNGVCVYIVGSNNNGQNTALNGSHDSRCQLRSGTVDGYTESKNFQAGFVTISYVVTKTGGLSQTATASDNSSDPIGAVGRNGQTFTSDAVKSNVKP